MIKYQYSLEGTVTNITYPDGSEQAYTLDKFSRVVTNTDAVGLARSAEFNQYAQISTQTCQQETTTYSYGNANHTNGLLISSSFRGSLSYQNQMSYDGFGRLKQNIATNSNSTVLLDTTYTIDSRGKVQSFESTSAGASDLNDTRQFAYDGMGQVISDAKTVESTTTTTKYTYDGNANVTSTTVNDQTTTMTYNAIDQRTDNGFEYDTNGRIVKDGQGQQYSFDDRDRLTAVDVDSSTTNKFAYYPDDNLANFAGGKESAQMYYDASKVNALRVTDDSASHKASMFWDSSSLTANFTDGNPDTCFLERLGSPSLLLEQDSQTSVTNSTYGEAAASSAIDIQSSFGLRQEFFDQSSGLVYLRSRYYNPKQMAFISMDSYCQENRYAYCQGDPINLVDPSGHGYCHGCRVHRRVGRGRDCGPCPHRLGRQRGDREHCCWRSGGAAAGVASGATAALVQGESYTLRQAGIDLVVGAAGGGVEAHVGRVAGQLVAEEAMSRTIVSGAAKSAARNSTVAVVRPVLSGQRVSALDVVSSAIVGGVSGAALSFASPQGLAVLRQAMRREALAGGETGVEMTTMQRAGPLALDNDADVSLDPAVSVRSSSQPSMADITETSNNAIGSRWFDRGSRGGVGGGLMVGGHDEL